MHSDQYLKIVNDANLSIVNSLEISFLNVTISLVSMRDQTESNFLFSFAK